MNQPTIIIYASAKRLVNSLSQRERKAYEYMLELLKNDVKSFRELDIAVRAGDDPKQTGIGYAKVHAMHDRLKFILNTFGLHANIHEGEIVLTTIA